MKRVATLLPGLIILSFPVIYLGGQAGNQQLSIMGIALLLLGMSGPVIRRFIRN